jgi:hypothetical protein
MINTKKGKCILIIKDIRIETQVSFYLQKQKKCLQYSYSKKKILPFLLTFRLDSVYSCR